MRKKFAQDVGFLPPVVHIRDNLELKPSAYRVSAARRGGGRGRGLPGMLLAINPAARAPTTAGTRTVDPAFGLPAVWIENASAKLAQMGGFTVVDCATVVATHLSHLMQLTRPSCLLDASRRNSWSNTSPSWPRS